MSRYVESHGRLLPRSLFDPPLKLEPGVCVQCGGRGVVPEQIDEDGLDVLVQCPTCQMFCLRCREWVPRAQHDCKLIGSEEETLP